VGIGQWLLMACWAVACFVQKLFGRVDAYYGASGWGEALKWILALPRPITSFQYWGHGSPGRIWLGQQMVATLDLLKMKPKLAPGAVVWFRSCQTFGGREGHEFSKVVADGLGCTVAGHTVVIGPVQAGLHTRAPGTKASWPIEESYSSVWVALRRPNTVTCLATRLPPSV
jgi:hypothetical protein